MIVKNEAKNIITCLNSLRNTIDYAYILDTGSTDDTREVIMQWSEQNNIPITVGYHPFTSFGEMRTMSFNLATETYKSDYILVLDARQILNGKIDKDKLVADRYDIMQVFITLHYYNARLLKSSLPWKCKAVVHEYWDYPDATAEQLQDVYITENGTVGDRTGKIKWYKELLIKGLEEETDPFLLMRYTFYLANSHYDLGEYQDAIEYYRKRLQMGGWIEEVWYCYYRIGMAYEKLDQQEAAIGYYIKGYKVLSTRAENLYRLSLIYRDWKDFIASYSYAQIGKRMSKSTGLFVESEVYEYLLDLEISISGFYVNKEEAKKSYRKLASMTIPEPYASCIKDNEKWYL